MEVVRKEKRDTVAMSDYKKKRIFTVAQEKFIYTLIQFLLSQHQIQQRNIILNS